MNQDRVDELVNEYTRITGIECSAIFMQNGTNHIPSKLLDSEKGVYVFLSNETTFKVGKSVTLPRWNSNHYKFSLGQNRLATKIIENINDFINYFPANERQNILEQLTQETTKEWIKANLSRIEFKISINESIGALNLLEGFLQFKLNPIYEGG